MSRGNSLRLGLSGVSREHATEVASVVSREKAQGSTVFSGQYGRVQVSEGLACGLKHVDPITQDAGLFSSLGHFSQTLINCEQGDPLLISDVGFQLDPVSDGPLLGCLQTRFWRRLWDRRVSWALLWTQWGFLRP